MKKGNLFPIIIAACFVVLVPVLRCRLFFDAFLIKLWIAQFGTGIIFIYFCRQILFKQGRVYINITADSLLLAYLLINVLSWLFIPCPYRRPALLTLNSLIVYIFLCFFTAQYLREERAKDLIIFLWIMTAAGICIYSIWQYLRNEKIIGTLGNENFLAAYIGISIPVYIGYFWRFIWPQSRMKSERVKLLLGLVIFLLFCITLYLTKSRGSWIGLFWALSSFAIIGWCPKGKRIAIAVILLLLLITLVYTPWGLNFIIDQFKGDVRPAIWEGTLYMIIGKPLLGWGKGAYFIFYPQFRIQDYWLTKSPTDLTIHAHNEFLQILSETGIIGLGIFLLLIFTVVRLGIKIIDETKGRKKYPILGITCGIIGLLTHNLVCNNLQMPSSAIFLWLTLGLMISYLPSRSLGLKLNCVFRYGFFLALTLFTVIIIWETGIRPIVSQYLFGRGLQYREKEKWDLAIENYTKAISWYPWDVEMHYRTAYAYTMVKQYDMAIQKYKDVIRLAPLYGSVHRNIGIVYMKKNENKLAIRSFLQQQYINEYDFISQVNLEKAKENYANKPH